MEFIPMAPHLVQKIWGGKNFKSLGPSELPIGELWVVSDRKEGSSLTPKGKLSDLLKGPLPYLVKFIDTQDNLSVQVHPDDEFAGIHENSKGKTECWVILDAEKGAGIYLGFGQKVNPDEFRQAVMAGEDVTRFMRFYPVARGDFFYVPAGAIHAIGKGVVLAEVQQSSGLTYRVWDWNRLDNDGNPRELHLEKALRVIRFDQAFNQPENFKYQRDLLNFKQEKLCPISHKDFCLQVINLKKGQQIQLVGMQVRPCAIICLTGQISLNASVVGIHAFEAMLIRNDKGSRCEISVSANEDTHLLFVS